MDLLLLYILPKISNLVILGCLEYYFKRDYLIWREHLWICSFIPI